jgi:endonuclease YncB( thermonuclease family)
MITTNLRRPTPTRRVLRSRPHLGPYHLRRITPREVGLVEREKDRYGRIGAEIGAPAGETSINRAMVEAGQAAVYPRYCKDPAFYAAERRTRETGCGIWGKDEAQQRPWEVRR